MRIVVFLVLCVAVPARADDKVDTAKVEEQARVLSKALLESDWAKLADMTYPKVVEMMGGRDKMIDDIDRANKLFKDTRNSFKKYTVGTAQAPVVDGKTIFVVVPTSLEVAGPVAVLGTDSYLLGVSSDSGKSWTFADEAVLSDPVKRKLVFPSLPAELKLPDRKPRKVIRD